MIRRLYRVVHTTLVGRPVLRAHDVVDAHVEAVVMIRDARTVSRCYVAVGELGSQSAVSIRYRRIVEVASEYYALSLMLRHIVSHSVNLWRTLRRRLAQNAPQAARLLFAFFALHVALQHRLEARAILGREARGLQMRHDDERSLL